MGLDNIASCDYYGSMLTNQTQGTNMEASKKITLATVKSFIRKNEGKLLISYKSSFNGMTDSVETSTKSAQEFRPVSKPEEGRNFENCLGIAGAWFVLHGRDSFSAINQDGLVGIHVYNCCGSFDLAVRQ